MPAVSRLGDGSSHGGHITSASTNVKANGIGVARQGDSHSCPLHGPSTLTAVTTKDRANSRLIITIGATAGCGATINSGSSTVFAH